MVLEFLRRHRRAVVQEEVVSSQPALGSSGSYRRTSTPEVGQEQEVVRYTAWSPGEDPSSSLITLAFDSRLTSDTVKRMRRQSSVQSLHKSGLTLLRQRKLFKSSHCAALSQSTGCLAAGSAEELSDSGYSSWEPEARGQESDTDSGVGTLTRPPPRPDLVTLVLAAHPALHPRLRAVFPPGVQPGGPELDPPASPAGLLDRLEGRLRAQGEEVQARLAALRVERVELEVLAGQVEGKLVSFRTVRRMAEFRQAVEWVGWLGARAEGRGEAGGGRLAEVRGWLGAREEELEGAVEWELGQGWAAAWRGYVARKREVVAAACSAAGEARGLEAQVAALATLR